jgi:hypothetical protein
VKRGLCGVHLVVSGAHEGLKQAIATVLTGATCHGAALKSSLPTVRRLLSRFPHRNRSV